MKEYSIILLIAGGVYNLFFAFFHMSFWWVNFLNWHEELPKISLINRAVIQMMNVAVTVFLLLVAYISFMNTEELLTSNLGKMILLGTAFFWFARLIGEFTLKKGLPAVPGLVITFIIGFLLYLIPAII